MSEVQRAGLKDRLVAGLERNGKRRRFDARAKDELIRACREPGTAIARIAREHGLNPNLLRQWINRDRQSLSGGGAMAATDGATPAFMPVVTSP